MLPELIYVIWVIKLKKCFIHVMLRNTSRKLNASIHLFILYKEHNIFVCIECYAEKTPFSLECHDMAQCEPLKNTKEFLLPI